MSAGQNSPARQARLALVLPLVLFLLAAALSSQHRTALLLAAAASVGLGLWVVRNLRNHQMEGMPVGKLGGGFWVSWLRLVALCAMIGMLGGGHEALPHPWAPFFLYAWVVLLDGLDGMAARFTQSVSSFGADLDNLLDGLGLFVASCFALQLGTLPGAYLILAAAYPVFHIGLGLRRYLRLHVDPSRMMQSLHNRYFAGAHMVVVSLALIPGWHGQVTHWVGMLGAVFLLACFVRDWFLVTQWQERSRQVFQVVWHKTAFNLRRYGGPVLRFGLLVLWLVRSEEAASASLVGMYFLPVFLGTYARTSAWLCMAALGLGLLELPAALNLPSLVTLGWVIFLGSGGCSLTCGDDSLYFRQVLNRRRALAQMGWTFGALLSVWWVIEGVSEAAVAQMALRIEALAPAKMIVLLMLNVVLILLMATRNWFFARQLKIGVSLGQWVQIRQAGFLVALMTPGPQVGGEPVQVAALCRRNVPVLRAAALVAAEKLLDTLVNLLVLSVLFFGLALAGMLPQGAPELFAVQVCSLAFVLLAVAGVVGIVTRRGAPMSRWTSNLAGELQRLSSLGWRVWGLLAGLGIWVWAGFLLEWWLIWQAVNPMASTGLILGTLLASRVALWAPIPGALGILEASLLGAVSYFGSSLADGLAVIAVVRARDLFLILSSVVLALKEALHGASSPGEDAGVVE